MTERSTVLNQDFSRYFIDVYTPQNIARLDRCEPHLLDALVLIRQGIWELRDINGIEKTIRAQSYYELIGKNPLSRRRNSTTINIWKQQEEGRINPFLLVAWNIKDNIVGVVEGLHFTYPETDERTMFINWVVVRDSGGNDKYCYTYRGSQVGHMLYDKAEEIASENRLDMLVVTINRLNTGSVRFHLKRGFYTNPKVPPYIISGIDSRGNPIQAEIQTFIKRLKHGDPA